MKKDTLQETILGIIGGLITSMGLCMTLVSKWKLCEPGAIIAIIGVIVLIPIYPIYHQHHPRQHHKKYWGLIGTIIVGIVGALILGYGMSRSIGDDKNTGDMIWGMIIGIVGLLICALNIPIYLYRKDKKS